MQPATAVATATLPQAPGNAIPEEVLSRWSWGPFFLAILWVFWNADKNYKILAGVIFVVGFIPFLNTLAAIGGIVFAIQLGLKGNRIMAANRQFPGGLEQFKAVQTAWARWGVIAAIAGLVFAVLMFVFVFAAVLMSAHGS